MARRHHQHSVSLFPFLAVLVCAMGSLILLLLVMTRKIRHDQQAELNTNAPPIVVTQPVDRSAELRALELDAVALQERITQLRQKVTTLRTELDEKRRLLATSRTELAGLQARLQTAPTIGSAAATESDLKQLQTEEAELLARLSATEQALLTKRDELTRA